MSEKVEIKNMIMLALYILFSAAGLALMKMGISRGFKLGLERGALHLQINIIALLGILLYVCSFLLSVLVMSKMNLTYFYPLSAGLIYILICLIGVLFLKETVSISQWIGMALILGGVIMMKIST